jgi:sialic acid synthase SpsE
MSGNHNGAYDQAEKLLLASARNGASAFKLQTYTPESMTLDCMRSEYVVNAGPWKGRNLFDLYKEGQTPSAWIPDLFQTAKENKIPIFSTPFSPTDVEILENNNVSAYKIASFEITYTQLLKAIGKTGKPVIFSTGLAKLDEIRSAFEILHDAGASKIAILKCSTSYPAKVISLNLSTIPYLIQTYRSPVGFSDHTIGNEAAIAAAALGATIFEKHVKLDDDFTSIDSSFSLPISQFPSYVSSVDNAMKSVGTIQDGPTFEEIEYLRYRRSIVAKRHLPVGTVISAEDLAVVRPDVGLPPKEFEKLIGRTVKEEILFGEGLSYRKLKD